MIDQEIYQQALCQRWSMDLCRVFPSYKEYQSQAMGAAILYDGKIVSGASSYGVYRDGIEIEIDTMPEYRRQGLARAAGAKLILACMEKGIYPSWDAQNTGSLALSEQLGYHFSHEYPAYEITNW